jgi:hypothetical protein
MHALGVSAEYLFIAFKPDLFAPLNTYALEAPAHPTEPALTE